MPSSTFLNLPAEKQEKLLEVATREFSHEVLNEASINQYIKDVSAQIPFMLLKASSDYPEEAFLFFFKFSSFFRGKKTTEASLSNR